MKLPKSQIGQVQKHSVAPNIANKKANIENALSVACLIDKGADAYECAKRNNFKVWPMIKDCGWGLVKSVISCL